MTWPWQALGDKIEYNITIKTDLPTIRRYDLIVFQRQEMPLVQQITRVAQGLDNVSIQSPWVSEAKTLRMGKQTGKKVIFDIDDDALNVPYENPNYLQWGRDKRKVTTLLTLMRQQGVVTPGGVLDKPTAQVVIDARERLKQLLANIGTADAVTVTTPWLKQVYSRYNRRVYVLPNWAVPGEWANVHPQEHDGIHLGWAGGPTHYNDIKVFMRPVKQMLNEYPHVKLVIAGFPTARQMFFADVPDDRIIIHPFMAEWRQNLATFDIILAPAADNKFNRGKSAIRIYEGLCATKGSAAVVGSETTYGETIRQLNCGYTCKSPADWLKSLRRLIKDRRKRREFGRRGYERMMKSHTYEANAHQWLDVYNEVLNG